MTFQAKGLIPPRKEIFIEERLCGEVNRMDKNNKEQKKRILKDRIKCPNCGKDYLEETKIPSGVVSGPERESPKIGTISIYECPRCHVLFHEEELKKQAEIEALKEKIRREIKEKDS